MRDAVALHRRVLTEQQELVPFWPARLPDFDGDWLVVGLRHPSFLPSEDDDPCDYIIVWRRGGTPSVNVPLSEYCHIEQIFPNPAVPEHAPDAKPWTVERMDPRRSGSTRPLPSSRPPASSPSAAPERLRRMGNRAAYRAKAVSMASYSAAVIGRIAP